MGKILVKRINGEEYYFAKDLVKTDKKNISTNSPNEENTNTFYDTQQSNITFSDSKEFTDVLFIKKELQELTGIKPEDQILIKCKDYFLLSVKNVKNENIFDENEHKGETVESFNSEFHQKINISLQKNNFDENEILNLFSDSFLSEMKDPNNFLQLFSDEWTYINEEYKKN
ncbi:hypothetical protein CWI37_1615p0010 [Hamiltosporidium tvaerminnensis]|uniref:Uncharacterized protein n=1 Tax=Hamiltosporidium tvaerminnensis TaxID=1176355 RepID=A0A4Q9KX70_9MICR|nr:hypothetical protein LUQ84_000626 [Hamiltosporidium tvaerminnensis]TBT98749.1 hypothetical protein CWI37_1615p0010 [Hamiltosporidium tvaerminnensis]